MVKHSKKARESEHKVPVKGSAPNVRANAKNEKKAEAASPLEAVRNAEHRGKVPRQERVTHQKNEIGSTGRFRRNKGK